MRSFRCGCPSDYRLNVPATGPEVSFAVPIVTSGRHNSLIELRSVDRNFASMIRSHVGPGSRWFRKPEESLMTARLTLAKALDTLTTAVAELRPTEIAGSRQGIGTTLRLPQTPRQEGAPLATGSLELEPASEYPLSPSSCPWWVERRHNRGRLRCGCDSHLRVD